ncbi:MAG TPA: hypothetical protein VJC03_04470, partial [bacterium]|nr:hypothetical protein [bacterium]
KVSGVLRNLFQGIKDRSDSNSSEDEPVRELFSSIAARAGDVLALLSRLQEYREEEQKRERVPVRVILTETRTGKAVPEIEIVFEKLKGTGKISDSAGNLLGETRAVVKTDAEGAAEIYFAPGNPEEEFLFNATFDELHVLLVPEQEEEQEDVTPMLFDDFENEEETEEEEQKKNNRAQRVMLALIKRMFKYLKENDVNMVSIDDHHPYTKEVMDTLQKLKEGGYIGHIQVHALPRGEDAPVEKQKCGSELIYKDRVEGKPWDNEGLKYLCHLARLQDLHIERNSLATELSKLIGSQYNKIDMVLALSRLQDRASLDNIMHSTGWDEKVRKYEEGLALVLPRTETNIASMDFIRRPADGNYAKHLGFWRRFVSLFR